jgi:hypothetical protein
VRLRTRESGIIGARPQAVRAFGTAIVPCRARARARGADLRRGLGLGKALDGRFQIGIHLFVRQFGE